MKYCENCGAPIKFMEKHVCPNEDGNPTVLATEKPPFPKKYKILIGCVCLAVFIGLIIASSVGVGKIDPFDYTSVSFEGYDSAGRVSVFFDEDALIQEIIGPEPSDLGEEYAEWFMKYDTYSTCVKCQYEPEEGLSNGDTVTVTFTVDDTVTSRIKAGKKEFTVEGLPELEKIDVFSNVVLKYEGVEGQAHAMATIGLDVSFFNDIRMNIEPNENLKNGDIITVSVSNVDDLAETYQQIPAEISRQYTVEGLPSYITEASQVPVDEVKSLAADFLKEKQANIKDEAFFSYSDVKLYGIYFMEPKEGTYEDPSLWIVVSCKEYMDGSFRDNLYFPLKFDDPIIQPDGTMGYKWDDGEHATFLTGDSFPMEYVTAKYNVTNIL